MKFKPLSSGIIFVAVAMQLATAAPGTVDSEMEAVRAKVRAQYPHVRQVSTADLANWLADTNRPSPVLLDVRTEAEYAVSHLPGARRVEPRAPATQIAGTLERNRSVVTYCAVGYRSSEMAQQLQKAGLTNVFSLDGSIFQWANEGRPLQQAGKATKLVHPFNRTFGELLRPELRATPGPPAKE